VQLHLATEDRQMPAGRTVPSLLGRARYKCDSVRLCWKLIVCRFVPASDPRTTSLSVRRISYFVVAHNAIIHTDERPGAACCRLVQLQDGTSSSPVALRKFAPSSIPDAKLDGNRRICFGDSVTLRAGRRDIRHGLVSTSSQDLSPVQFAFAQSNSCCRI